MNQSFFFPILLNNTKAKLLIVADVCCDVSALRKSPLSEDQVCECILTAPKALKESWGHPTETVSH